MRIHKAVNFASDRCLAGAALITADAVDDIFNISCLGFVGQLGIGKRGTSHCYEIGLSVAQHCFGHVHVVVTSDCYDGDIDRRLYRRHIIGIVHDGHKTRRNNMLL